MKQHGYVVVWHTMIISVSNVHCIDFNWLKTWVVNHDIILSKVQSKFEVFVYIHVLCKIIQVFIWYRHNFPVLNFWMLHIYSVISFSLCCFFFLNLHCYRNLHIYLSVCLLCKSDTWLNKLMRCIKWWGLHRGLSLISCWAVCPDRFKEWIWKKTGPLQLGQCLLATVTTEGSCSLDSLSLQSHKLDFFFSPCTNRLHTLRCIQYQFQAGVGTSHVWKVQLKLSGLLVSY